MERLQVFDSSAKNTSEREAPLWLVESTTHPSLMWKAILWELTLLEGL